MSGKTLKDIQREVHEYISQFKEGYFKPLSMLARMTEEVGELAREVNHRYGEKPKKPGEAENTIANELGDIIFIVTCFANSLEIDLEKAFDDVMEKYRTRDANRWTRIENKCD
jgi:NTP pyrophosphatase (non-canonical NTP hydrolase)